MNSINVEINMISDLAITVTKRIIDANEKTNLIDDPNAGPLQVASALSDFFQLASGLENQKEEINADTATELAHYSLDLIDRLSYQLRQLDVHDQRDNLAKIFLHLSAWFIRRGAVLDNLSGIADGFANLVNGAKESDQLKALGTLGDEIMLSVSSEISLDKDRSDPWRPWRVINLNIGIAATRSLDPSFMKMIFDKLERRLPYDLPGFFSDGKRQMISQNVPDEVRSIMNNYADKWPVKAPH